MSLGPLGSSVTLRDNLRKKTLVPITTWDPSAYGVDFPIGQGVRLADVDGLLAEKDFSLWERHVPHDTVSRLVATRVALVHDFESPFGSGIADKESQDLLHEAFVALRLIRPTRAVFECVRVQYRNNETDVQGFTHSHIHLPNVPDAEVLALVEPKDIAMLVDVFAQLRALNQARVANDFLDPKREAIFRAIEFHERGYVDSADPVAQIIFWMIGIEAIIRSDERSVFAQQNQIILDINSRFGERNIYEDYRSKYHYQNLPPVPIRTVLENLFEFRNELVHGMGIQKKWLHKTIRRNLLGEPVLEAEVLRETAPFVLRILIREAMASLA